MNKHFKEVLTHKALSFKLSGCPGIFLESKDSEGEIQVINVCAPIPMAINKKLESVTDLLNISKRQFLSLALESAIYDAEQVINEVDVFEHETPVKPHTRTITLTDAEESELLTMSSDEQSAFMLSKLEIKEES